MPSNVRRGQRRDARSSQRRSARHKVTIQQTACFTLNVGDGGFCVGMVRVLPPGSAVEGAIDIGGTPVPFKGSVAWAKAGDSRLGVRGLMGVRYVDPTRR